MPYFDEFAKTFTSVFSPPVPRPNQLVSEAPHTCVEIPNDWLRYLIGMLEVMRHTDFWQGTPAERDSQVRQVEALIERFSLGSPCQEVSIVMGVRVGQVLDGFWNSCPSGTLALDGSDYDQNDYPALVTVLQENASLWASIGDQPVSGRFTLPDFSVAVAIGVGQRVEPHTGKPTAVASLEVGDFGGEMKHQLVADELPSHSHPSPAGSTGYRVRDLANPDSEMGASDVNSALSDETGETGDDDPHNNLQPYVAVRKCIVYDISEYSTVFKLRQSPDDNCLLEQSFDGETWSPAFDFGLCLPSNNTVVTNIYNEIINNDFEEITNIYDGTPESVNPDLVYGDGLDAVRNYGLCTALYVWFKAVAAAAAIVEQERYEDQADLHRFISALLDKGATAVGAGVLAGLFGVAAPYIVISLASGALFASFLSEVNQFLADEVSWDDDNAAWEFACCMVDEIGESLVTESGWRAAIAACLADAGDVTYVVTYLISVFYDSTDAYLGFLQVWQEMFELGSVGAELPCACVIETCFETDLTVTLGDWFVEGEAGWNEGVGAQHNYPNPPAVQPDTFGYLRVFPDPQSVITRVKANWKPGRNNDGVQCTIRIEGPGGKILANAHSSSPSQFHNVEWNGQYLLGADQNIVIIFNGSAELDAVSIINSVEICGQNLGLTPGESTVVDVDFSAGLQGLGLADGTFDAINDWVIADPAGDAAVHWIPPAAVIIEEVDIYYAQYWTGGGTQVQVRAQNENVVLINQNNNPVGDGDYHATGLSQQCTDYLRFLVQGNASESDESLIYRIRVKYHLA